MLVPTFLYTHVRARRATYHITHECRLRNPCVLRWHIECVAIQCAIAPG